MKNYFTFVEIINIFYAQCFTELYLCFLFKNQNSLLLSSHVGAINCCNLYKELWNSVKSFNFVHEFLELLPQ